LIALTLNAYAVPGVKPVIVTGEVDALAVTVSVVLEITYEVIVAPPVLTGAVKETVALVDELTVTETAVTESGTVA
jgi:hypothetical protein